MDRDHIVAFFSIFLSCSALWNIAFASAVPGAMLQQENFLKAQGSLVVLSADRAEPELEGIHLGLDYMLARYNVPQKNALASVTHASTAIPVYDVSKLQPLHSISELENQYTNINSRGSRVFDRVKLEDDNVGLVFFDTSISGSQPRVYDAASTLSALALRGSVTDVMPGQRAVVKAKYNGKTSYLSLVQT